jgi:hypothetical protein
MSYSKNISKLLFNENATPQTVIREINQALSPNDKQIKYSPPFQIAPETPVSLSLEGENLAKFEAQTPEFPPPPRSPEFPPPQSPDYSPPLSPEFPPPSSLETNENIVEQTGQQTGGNAWKKDDIVCYHGDVMPGRKWKIRNVGDRFVTIETDVFSPETDNILVVVPTDLYSPEHLQTLYPQTNTPSIQAGGANIPVMQPVTPVTPPMNVTPVIKIFNGGGNDFSTSDIPINPPVIHSPISNSQPINNVVPTISSSTIDNIRNNEITNMNSDVNDNKIDLNSLPSNGTITIKKLD